MVDNVDESINNEAEKFQEGSADIDNQTTDNKKNIVNDNIGLDIGTMNLVSAISNNNDKQINTFSSRNVFLPVDKDSIGDYDLNLINHTIIDENLYILSDDAYRFANLFGLELSRPMNKGMISPDEIDAIDILSVLIKSLINTGSENSTCCYSIPADPIDGEKNVVYHKEVFKRVIQQLNYKPIAIYEGSAVVYAECSETNFSGIGISFGDGMTNVSVMYKAVPIVVFSIEKGGGWIDQNAAMNSGVVKNRATAIKERSDFDINNFTQGKKKERRIREALAHYYRSLIDYTTKNIIFELDQIETEFPSEMPVVVSGGTSLASGFLDSVKEILNNYEFPFDISEVRHAKNPLTVVAEGCLVKSLNERSK